MIRFCRPRRKCRGFTLIELLVVISIIALLIGLLLPALSAAKAVAISAKCLANQHGLGIAMANYEADNQGALPGIQTLMPAGIVEDGNNGPGELGAQNINPASGSQYFGPGGWMEGTQIYATFSTGQGDTGNVGFSGSPYFCVGTDGPYVAESPTNPEYCAPCGLGYLGPYVSPDGTMADTSGTIFYCPGTVASFGPMAVASNAESGAYYTDNAYFSERGGAYGSGLYSTFLADWGKQPGQSSVTFSVGVANPEVYSTYIYRSGRYYDGISTDGHVISNGQVDTWHSCGPTNNSDGYPKSDTPYLNGECYMVCDSEIAGTFPPAYQSYPYYGGGISWMDNVCHLGRSVNRAFHDGSARTFTVPLGQLPPYNNTGLVGYWVCPDSQVFAPPMMEVTNWSYGYYIWPYYWAVLDGGGVFSDNP